jgi:hypothetical protein
MRSVKNSIAAGHKMVYDANLQDMSNLIGCRMAGASSNLRTTLAMATVTSPQILVGRQQTILYLRSRMDEIKRGWEKRFERIADIENELTEFFKHEGKDKDSLEEDAIAQLSFKSDLLKPLNHIPWLLLCMSLFKVWVVPAMSICMPILVWIMPYILLRYVYGLPISQDQYYHIIQQIMSGNINIPTFEDIPAPNMGQPTEPWSMKTIFQYGMFSFTFAQSMIQPVQNAMHLYKTDMICHKIGSQILELRTLIRHFRADIGPLNGIHVKLSYSLDHIDEMDPRRAFISIKEYPANIHMIFRDLAHLECMWRIACIPSLNPVIFSKGAIKLKDCIDLSLKGVEAVKSTLDLHEKPHAILTGPNGGGKSSFLRSVLQSVLIGHAYGVAPAGEASMPRFTWVASGIQLRDTPGELSMFETEVKFASECIRAARAGGPGIVLFDELFHSTNPPDSARTATQFLRRLWNQSETFSVISTHLFPLLDSAPSNVQPICCPATKGDDGNIRFEYGVQDGVCTVSSVHTVWERFGLVAAARAPGATSKVSTEKRTNDAQ